VAHRPRDHLKKKRHRPRDQHEQRDWPDIIYGKNPVCEALRARRRKVLEILMADDPKRLKDSPIVKLAGAQGVTIKQMDIRELNFLTHDGVHQNVVARVQHYPEYLLNEIFENGAEKNLVLVLDCIQDPQNFGTLCRSALAFGVKEVIVPKDRSAPISSVVCKASAGAVEHLKIISVTNLVRAMEELKKHEYWIYGASLEDRSVSLQKLGPAPKTALVLGSEGKGLRRLVAETCDELVKIPMAGDFDSLNVAQAGSVILYDFGRKIFV